MTACERHELSRVRKTELLYTKRLLDPLISLGSVLSSCLGIFILFIHSFYMDVYHSACFVIKKTSGSEFLFGIAMWNHLVNC